MVINTKIFEDKKENVYNYEISNTNTIGKITNFIVDNTNKTFLKIENFGTLDFNIFEGHRLIVNNSIITSIDFENKNTEIISNVVGNAYYYYLSNRNLPFDYKNAIIRNINYFSDLDLNFIYIDNLEIYKAIKPILLGISTFSTLFPFSLVFKMENIRNSLDFINFKYPIFLKEYREYCFNDLKRFVSLLSCGSYPAFKRIADKFNLNLRIYCYIGYNQAIIRVYDDHFNKIYYLKLNLSDHYKVLRHALYDELVNENYKENEIDDFFLITEKLNFHSFSDCMNYTNNEIIEYVEGFEKKYYESKCAY